MLAILFGSGLTLLTAWSLGRRLLHREDVPPLVVLTGAAALSLVVFAACALRIAYPAVFLAISAAAIGSSGRFRLGRGISRRPALLLIPFAVYFVLYLANAMAPEVSPDGTAYHLSLVARYLRDHGFVRITTNMYANLSQGLEMLFLFAFAFGRHSAAAMVHFAFLPALAWSMWLYGKRAGFPLPAACAALLVFASPVVGIDATSAYNDVALAAVVFGVFLLLRIWEEERDPVLLPAVGLLAGFAYAIKYTGGVAVLYALGFVGWKSWRKRDPRLATHLAIITCCAALLMLPWMAKDWLWLGNPVSPFFNGWFPNPYITVAFEKEYKEYLSHYNLKSLWELPMQVTTRGLLSGLLGPVFLLSPIAFAAVRHREGRRLLLAAGVFGALYFSNVGTRFLIPTLPFVALAMMLAFERLPHLTVALALVHAVISWPGAIPTYARPEAWHLRRLPWKYALRLRPEEEYRQANLIHYGAVRMIEQSAHPGATVFTYTPVPEAYTSRNVLVAYQAAENKVSGAIQWTGFVPQYAPTWRLRFSFPRQPLRAVRVVQTAEGPREQWNIHELRIYDAGRELSRAPQWRLTANPYPWGIQNAFDNSVVTFWICGEWLRPGQFVRVDFGVDEIADAVVIQTAHTQTGIRLKLEGMDFTGQWKLLAATPHATDTPRPIGLSRAVAEELKRRGIDYMLVFGFDFGSAEIQKDADIWGIREVAHDTEARLYKLP